MEPRTCVFYIEKENASTFFVNTFFVKCFVNYGRGQCQKRDVLPGSLIGKVQY